MLSHSKRLQAAHASKSRSRVRPQRNRIQLEALESRTLLTSIPTGAVEVLNANAISGWVFNADDGANALNAVITIDGHATTLTADVFRADLFKKLGSSNHGFTFAVPGLSTGIHTVTVDLVDPFTNFAKRLKAANVIIAPPTGGVDVFTKSTISGWAFSPANHGDPISVVVTVDGHANFIAANAWRADLAKKVGSPYHAFSFAMPMLGTGVHTVTVDEIDGTTGAVKRIKAGTIAVTPPTGSVDVLNGMKISGWAFGAANNGAANDIMITINGNQFTVKADDWRADLAKKVGSPYHAFAFAMPTLKLGANSVAVDVVDPSTGAHKRLKTGTVVIGGPVGAVTVFSAATISGWGLSPLEGGAPINAVITINGQATTVVADDLRPELLAKYGSASHGFTFAVPALAPGNNVVTVDLVDPFNGQLLRIKSGILVNRPPAGVVDVFTASRIAGYVTDPDMPWPLLVQVKVNGVATSEPFSANNVHKLKGATGIGFDVAGDFAGKIVEVFAYDFPSGQAYRIWTNNHSPRGALTTATPSNITGWAIDPDAPFTPAIVRVDIDGVTLTTATANLTRADGVALTGVADVGFSVDIPGLTPGSHTIAVYAIDGQSVDTPPVLLGAQIVTNAAPIGNVDVASSAHVTGWALDPDLGAAATTVNVYIDDTLFATTAANGSRPDLIPFFGTPNHGFDIDLSSLTNESHSITVTALDNRISNQPEVVIYDSFINNQAPIGVIELFNGKTISGFAYDPDATDDSIPVDIYLDGAYSRTVTANLGNNNAPTANHGFSVDVPPMSYGSHTIEVYASESQGNVSVLIGSKVVTNLRPLGVIESASATTITGWAADPDRLGESMLIKVFINGTLAVTGTGNTPRPDLLTLTPLNSAPGFSDYGFNLMLPTLSAGVNRIDVFAIDLNNSSISSLGSLTLVV